MPSPIPRRACRVIPHLIRGDTVLDAVSRIYPLFIPKENCRQYRPGYWGARPPLFFSRKRKGKAKRKLPADVRKLKNDCEVRGKRTRRARFAAAVRLAIQLQVLDRYTSAQTSFSHVRPSPPFFFPLSPIGRTGLRVLVIAPDTVIWSSRTLMRNPGNTGLGQPTFL